MPAFHLSNHLWPAMEPHNSTWIEGESPLIWTMLYLPMDNKQLTTYTWNGHLDNFMSWSQGQTECMTAQPMLILYTRWNICQGPDLPAMKSSAKIPYSQCLFQGHHKPPAKPTQLSTPDLQQHKTPMTSMTLTKGLTFEPKHKTPSCSSVQSKVATISNNVWTRPKMDPVDDMSQLDPGAPTRVTPSLRGTLLVQKDTQAI